MKKLAVVSFLLCLGLLAGVAATAQAAPQKKLFLFNWSQYMDPSIIKAFENKYHVKVVRSFYTSNPEMFAKLRAGGDHQYDVIFPSNYYVPRLIHTGLIQPLDDKLVPNRKNIMARFDTPNYDPRGRYTAPYLWGDTGIAYNTAKLGKQPDSWSILFDTKANPNYPFAMAGDAQVMLGAACAYQGHGYACTGRQDWKQAARLLLRTKKRPNFNSFINGTPVLRRLARGSVDAGVTYNGDYVFYKDRNPEGFKHIKFIVPKEGAELWVDTMAIPAHAPHPQLANKFINFILDAKIGAKLANWNAYASPNEAARPYLDKVLRQPPIMPTPEQMKRLHFTPAVAGDQLQFVQQIWSEVQSR